MTIQSDGYEDCYGCGHHHLHAPTASGYCSAYCDACAEQLAAYVAEMDAQWRAWQAAGMPTRQDLR